MANMQLGGETRKIPDEDVEIVQTVERTPVAYVDGAQGFVVVNGNVRVSLFRISQDLSEEDKGSIKKIINQQLIMTPEVALGIGKWLVERAEDVLSQPNNPESGDGGE